MAVKLGYKNVYRDPLGVTAWQKSGRQICVECATLEAPAKGPQVGPLAGWALVWTLLGVFAGGMALNLTPCVYPIIPITVSYFGGYCGLARGRLLGHGLLYLAGLALTNSTLGVAAALTGGLMGSLLQNPLVLAVVAFILIFFAASLFGLWELRLPSRLTQAASKSYAGYFGSLFMGLTLGLVAAPCIGPFVLGLLTFVGEKGDPLLGFLMFFALSLGLGIPFVVLAMFSGAVSSLPRSGMWMVWVKQVFGFILLTMAVYFLQPLLPKTWYAPVLGLTLAVAGVTLGWITKVAKAGRVFTGIKWVTGFAFITAGAFFLLPAKGETGPRISWEKASVTAIEQAKSAGKPVIVDFTADWCLPCKELESFTFSDKAVAEFSKSFVMLKADVTTGGDAEVEWLKKKFNVVGVPTIVFIGKDGAERAELRLVGFVEAAGFLAKMKNAGGR